MPRKRSPLDHLLQTDHDPAETSPLPYTDSSREDRSNERHKVAIDAALRIGNADIAIRVHDLSQSGLTIQGANGLRSGQRCTINLPGLHARAIDVIWIEGTHAGACFADLLPRAVLKRLLSRFGKPHV